MNVFGRSDLMKDEIRALNTCGSIVCSELVNVVWMTRTRFYCCVVSFSLLEIVSF